VLAMTGKKDATVNISNAVAVLTLIMASFFPVVASAEDCCECRVYF